MPFINSKIGTKVTPAQEEEIKSRLGEAISILPGKSENWLMVGIEPEYHLYFRGDNVAPCAMVEVSAYGGENAAAFDKLTGAITQILGDVLGISADHVYVKYDTTMHWGYGGRNF